MTTSYLKPQPDGIPDELKQLPQWVCWRPEMRDGKMTKVPLCAKTGSLAKTDTPSTWSDFSTALSRYKNSRGNIAGIGFVFSKDDPYAGIDLDDCYDPASNAFQPWAFQVINEILSYTEYSVSGEGAHIIVNGKLPPGRRKKGDLEMYEHGRFFCFTGHHVFPDLTRIEYRDDQVAALHARWFQKDEDHREQQQPAGDAPVDDDRLFEVIRRSRNAQRFDDLFRGAWDQYHPSHSEADLDLCNLLAFWTGKDAHRMDAIFRRSGLFRSEKWDRSVGDGVTYGERTIAKAIDDTKDVYSPGQKDQDKGPQAESDERFSEDQHPFTFSAETLDRLRVGRFLQTVPEKIRWTFADSLPQGSLGFVVANGGVGKSFLLLQSAVSVASNLDCLDGVLRIGERGKVFAIFGEDTEVVIHHRLRSIVKSYTENPAGNLFDARSVIESQIDENLFALAGAGVDLRLLEMNGNNPQPTQGYQDLLAMLKMIDNLKLVIIDPVSRFYAGSENDNTQATYFCSLLERITTETGATVIMSHHSNKAASNPQEPSFNFLHQGAIRGASGFTNAARWQLNLTTVKGNEVRQIGGDPKDASRYVLGKVVKKNLGKPESHFWLERSDGGVLRQYEVDHEVDNIKAEIVERIRKMEEVDVFFTVKTFSREYKDQWPGLSARQLSELLTQMIDDGLLFPRETRGNNNRLFEYLFTCPQEEGKQTDFDNFAKQQSYNANSQRKLNRQ